MTIEILVPPSITPTHTMTATEWNRAFYRLVPNGRCTLAGRHEEDMLCVFETGAQLIVKRHAHTPADVVRFADEHDMLNPITREETIARLRVHQLVASLPPDVLAEAEQALSGLTISDQDKPTCKKWQSTDTATHDFRLVGSWAEAHALSEAEIVPRTASCQDKLSVAPARSTDDVEAPEESTFGRYERDVDTLLHIEPHRRVVQPGQTETIRVLPQFRSVVEQAKQACQRPHQYTRDRWIAACVAQSGCVNRPDDEDLDGGEHVVLEFRNGLSTFKWRSITPAQAIEQARAAGLLS